MFENEMTQGQRNQDNHEQWSYTVPLYCGLMKS